MFPWFTIIPLKQLYTLWAHLVNISEARSQTKQTLQVETTSVVFCLRVGLRGSCKKSQKSQKRHMRHRRKNLVQISARHIRMVSSTFSNVCCVINRISSLSHSPDCYGPQRIVPNHFGVVLLLLLASLGSFVQTYFPHDEH